MTPAELRLTATASSELRTLVLPDGIEHAAVITCTVVRRADRTVLIARAVVGLDDGDVATSGDGFHLEVSPIALARLAKAAAARGETLVVVHSHPFPGRVAASPIDLARPRLTSAAPKPMWSPGTHVAFGPTSSSAAR